MRYLLPLLLLAGCATEGESTALKYYGNAGVIADGLTTIAGAKKGGREVGPARIVLGENPSSAHVAVMGTAYLIGLNALDKAEFMDGRPSDVMWSIVGSIHLYYGITNWQNMQGEANFFDDGTPEPVAGDFGFYLPLLNW